jgi:hypothetical protein
MAAVTKNRNFCKWPKLSILSLAAILVESQDHRTQFWKGTTQESFQQSLVEIGSIVHCCFSVSQNELKF